MPPRKLKPIQTPEGFRQSQITEYFRNTVPRVQRKLFMDETSRSKMSVCKGKIMDSDSESDERANQVTLPYPLISDDEDTDGLNNVENEKTKVKLSKTTNDSLSKSFGKVKPNNENMIPSTKKALNNPSTSNVTQESKPMASSTPLKANYSFDGTLVSQSKNVSILENVILTPKKTASEGKGLNDEEILDTPSKRSKMEVTFSETPFNIKVAIDVTGGFDKKILDSQDKLHSTDYMIQTDSPPKTEKVTLQTSSIFPKKSPKKIKISSPTSPTKRRTNGSPKQATRSVKFSLGLKPEEEDEKLNLTQLEQFKKLFQETLNNKNEFEVLTEADMVFVEEFLKMDVNHQYFLIKLFRYLPKWYNIVKFCTNIKLDQKLSSKEITSLYEYHKKSRFVDTDLAQLSTDELLDLLMLGDLKKIAKDFKIDKKKYGTKIALIDYLKHNCKRQNTLTKKSSEDVLKDAALKHLGYCIKLREDARSSFDKVYVLQTCSSSSYCMDVQKFLKDVIYDRVVFPDCKVENYNPFKNKQQFSRYYESIKMKKELYLALESKNNVTVKNICDEAFKKLQFLQEDGKWNRHSYDYLQKFSAEYMYISILKSVVKKLTAKHFEDVKIWLEFLIENYPMNHAIGFWYKQLAHIYLQYYKNYESAASIVIKAFEFNKLNDIFDFLQIHELNKIANKIRTTKSYKVCALYCDQLAALSELPANDENFPKIFIKGCTDRSGTPGKRVYSSRDSNNEVTYGSVENIALKHYLDKENLEGIHCEGKFIKILFTLFFWDIIYEYYVPLTFISKLQSAPLDMYSDSFYVNRKEEIESRLREIASEWPEEKLKNTLEDNWKNHSHERSISDFEGLGKELDEVLKIFNCIDRQVLSKIFGRLVTNIKRFQSGLPDLFLWNQELLECKFVEVKGENDRLQPNQVLWIKHLIEVGANVQVCHVSGVGAKKMTTEDDE